jgi:hypothetical protein
MADRSFMGKVYLAPRSECAKTGHPDKVLVYLNFGWVTKGNQQFPEYNADIMGNTFKSFQYSELESSIKTYIDQHGITFGTAAGLSVCCMVMPVFCICIYPYLSGKSKAVVNGVKEIVEKYNNQHGQHLRVQLCEYSSRVAMDDAGVDQNNITLSAKDEDGNSYPTWPPLGLNIIFEVRGERSHWPRLLASPYPPSSTIPTAVAYPSSGSSGYEHAVVAQQYTSSTL